LHRSASGEWVWSSDDESSDENGEKSEQQQLPPGEAQLEQKSSNSSPTTEAVSPSETVDSSNDKQLSSSQPVNLVLRMRNSRRELNDIRFEYIPGKDTADGIASELVGAGLVEGKDMLSIAANLSKLIDTRETVKAITFPLSSNLQPNEVPDDKTLIGFASMSITD